MKRKTIIRKAVISDAAAIHSLINQFSRKDNMLPRSLNEIYEHVRDFLVCFDGKKLVAVCALHIAWEDLAEIRSIAVIKKYQGRGIGKRLINRSLKEAQSLGIHNVFVLTYFPDYFKKLGFQDIDKNELPHKIWGDCMKCPKFPNCKEVAVIKPLDV